MSGTARIAGLYRYPMKGLTPEPLTEAALRPGDCIAWDRAFAIENGTADFDPAAPKHFPKIKFLMLMRNERLARLRSRFDDESTTLAISEDGRELIRADLMTPDGRAAIEAFFSTCMKDELRGVPRLVHAPDFSLSDAPAKLISIINLASVRALEDVVGRPIDPLRFRANVYVEGLEPWEDHEWVGTELRLGGATLKGVFRTQRCAATNVDPVTAERDMEIPTTLQRQWGHMDLGLYTSVVAGGTIRPGDELTLA